MKKPKEKRLIQMTVTKEWLTSRATNKYFTRNLKVFIPLLIVWIIIEMYFSVNDNSLAGFIALAPAVLIYCYVMYKGWQSGKKFWEDIKDKDQPINID